MSPQPSDAAGHFPANCGKPGVPKASTARVSRHSGGRAHQQPVVGITAYVEPATWAAWVEVEATLVPHGYVRHVQEAGGVAVVLPPLPLNATENDARRLLSGLDALILAGGVDIDPGRYGESPHPAVQPSRPDRDSGELLLARVTQLDDLPVLGVCRGMQVMAVAAGGSLEQHLPDRLGNAVHSPDRGIYGEHRVRIADETQLQAILGPVVEVATYHHQGVAAYPGYQATAWSDDGVVEAFEDPRSRFRVAVQWHPEVGSDPRIFQALVAAATR